MTALEVVRAAIPDATEAVVEHILWGRTPFPCVGISARQLYQAAVSFRRAKANGIELCAYCHRPALEPDSLCASCRDGLRRACEVVDG